MQILCCYHNVVQSDCAVALKRYAPETEYVKVDKDDPYFYARTIGEHWNKGKSLLIIEPDVEITAEVIGTMSDCDEPWCSYAYDIFAPPLTRECATGLGCTKFSAALQSEMDYQARIMEDECEKCHLPHCSWGELDCRISWVIENDFKISIHKHGFLNHYHPYKSLDQADIVSVHNAEASIKISNP